VLIFGIIGVLALIGVVVAGGFALGHLPGDRPVPSVGAPTTSDVLTSDSSCTTMSGHEASFSVQVTNKSQHVVTLTGATVSGLPPDLIPAGAVSWMGCDPGDKAVSGPVSLAPGGSQWLTLPLTLTTACPQEANPTITVDYTDRSTPRTQDFPVGPLSTMMPCP
jgi:hypothetical protein